MTQLQTDILEIYNSLVEFSDVIVKSPNPQPIVVKFDEEYKALRFEGGGKTVYIYPVNYYCLGLLDFVKHPSYLLPNDYVGVMTNLENVLNSGKLIESRTCISPENYGFNIFSANNLTLKEGPELISKVRFVSGTSWLFKLITKYIYKL